MWRRSSATSRCGATTGRASCPSARSNAIETIAVHAIAFDFDRDGDLDLVMAAEKAVSVLLNDGHGLFERDADIAIDFYASHVAAGDLDRDGDDDLVVCGSHLYVLWNRGPGHFVRELIDDQQSERVAIADIDGCGGPDIILNEGIVMNTGDPPQFTLAARLPGMPNSATLIPEDLEGDGDVDVLGLRSQALHLWLNRSEVGP